MIRYLWYVLYLKKKKKEKKKKKKCGEVQGPGGGEEVTHPLPRYKAESRYLHALGRYILFLPMLDIPCATLLLYIRYVQENA